MPIYSDTLIGEKPKMFGLGLGVRIKFYLAERANKLHAHKHWHKLIRAVNFKFRCWSLDCLLLVTIWLTTRRKRTGRLEDVFCCSTDVTICSTKESPARRGKTLRISPFALWNSLSLSSFRYKIVAFWTHRRRIGLTLRIGWASGCNQLKTMSFSLSVGYLLCTHMSHMVRRSMMPTLSVTISLSLAPKRNSFGVPRLVAMASGRTSETSILGLRGWTRFAHEFSPTPPSQCSRWSFADLRCGDGQNSFAQRSSSTGDLWQGDVEVHMGEFKIEKLVAFFSSIRGRLFKPCFYASMCRIFDTFDET